MLRSVKPSVAAYSPQCFIILLIVSLMTLHGCARIKQVQVQYGPFPAYPEEKLERHDFFTPAGEDVVGGMAVIRLEKGDTLPDIARHFGLGTNTVTAANPNVDVWAPEAGQRILLPMRFILPDGPRNGIVINLPAMRLFHFKNRGKAVATYPLGIGTEERPTPMGDMHVTKKVTKPTWYVPASIAADHRKKGDILPPQVLPGPDNPLGEYALYLSKPSYLIHGTNKPASIGLRATNGCMRLYPENIKKLYEQAPVGTKVRIVNQPYLAGRADGIIYLEAHMPFDDLPGDPLEDVYEKLAKLERKSSGSIDWSKVRKTLAEAIGYPVPVSKVGPGIDLRPADIVEVNHPHRLLGSPVVPELQIGAWYVWVADKKNEIDAVRLAAMVNHQGPPIPARVLARRAGYRVLAGPFRDKTEAADAIKRLRFDLEIEGRLIAPDRKK